MVSTRELNLDQSRWPSRFGFVPSLDGLRAVSIILVLVGHFVLPASLVGVSALGVKVFFFISGFLITRLLLAEYKANANVNLFDFYMRRVLRLYPVLIVYMALVIGITLLRGESFNPIDALSVFFYYVNYLLSHYETLGQQMSLPIGVLWSLSVEEHFYLFAPLAFVLVRGDARRMLTVALAICVFSLGIRLLYAWLQPEIVDQLVIYKHSETRFDSIAFGVVFACLTELIGGRRLLGWLSSPLAFAIGVIVLLGTYAIRDNYFENTWRFTIQGLALFPIVAGLVLARPFPMLNWLLNTPPLVWIGRLSYSLYVWHGGVLFLFSWVLVALPHAAVSSAEVLFTLALATVSYYVVEKPVLGLRARFRREAKPTPPLGQAVEAS